MINYIYCDYMGQYRLSKGKKQATRIYTNFTGII